MGRNGISKDGENTRFSSDNQPKNRRTSTKILTEMLIKDLASKKDIIIEGYDVLTGEKRKIRVAVPTKAIITRALLTKAAKGDVTAIKEVFDRVEGKPQIDITSGGKELPAAPAMQLIQKIEIVHTKVDHDSGPEEEDEDGETDE